MQPRIYALSLLVIALVVQISPTQPRLWALTGQELAPTRPPKGLIPVAAVTQADLTGDGKVENLSVVNGTAHLTSGGREDWRSPASWQVTQAALGDLDQDGTPEVILLVWRPFRPWPVDQWLPQGGRIALFHDAAGNSCQIILIGWREGGYRELWAGSALAEPVKSFSAADLDGDGRQELVTLEGDYSDARSAPARLLKVWEWNGFGFSIVSKVGGRFGSLSIVHSPEGNNLILVP